MSQYSVNLRIQSEYRKIRTRKDSVFGHSSCSDVVTNLNIPHFNQIDGTSENISDPVIKAIVKYKAHPSVTAIKESCTSQSNFNFSFVEKVYILKEIKTLQSNKVTQNTNIPTKLIKDNADIFAEFVFTSLNKCVEQSVSPSKLKLANITPVLKKKSKSSKDNYRPVSILSSISKVYENFMFKQMSEYFESFSSKYQCGIQEGIQCPILSFINVSKMEICY